MTPSYARSGTSISAIRSCCTDPRGNGKTTIAEHLLTYLGGAKDSFYEIEGTEGMSEYQSIGGFHPLSMSGNPELAERFVFKHGIVAHAIFDRKNLLIDEFTRAPSSAYSDLFLLLSLGTLPLEYEGKTLEKPDGWILIATANFGDEGTYRLSSALKRRFVPIDVGYPSNSTERSLLASIAPDLDEKVMDAILMFAPETRAIWKKERAPLTLAKIATIAFFEEIRDARTKSLIAFGSMSIFMMASITSGCSRRTGQDAADPILRLQSYSARDGISEKASGN